MLLADASLLEDLIERGIDLVSLVDHLDVSHLGVVDVLEELRELLDNLVLRLVVLSRGCGYDGLLQLVLECLREVGILLVHVIIAVAAELVSHDGVGAAHLSCQCLIDGVSSVFNGATIEEAEVGEACPVAAQS